MKKALVLSLICVLGLAFSSFAATLSGLWDTDVTIDPQQTNFNDAISLTSKITVNYVVGYWTFTSITSLSEAGWVDQDFNVAGVLGAFEITSALDFNPEAPMFGKWVTTAGVSIAGVGFDASFTLENESVALVLSGSGVAGDVSVDVDVSFGDPGVGCDLDWTGVDITLGFPFDCVDIEAVISFGCLGFESACFGVDGILVPMLPYMSLDIDICFDLEDGKTVTLDPDFVFGDFACIEVGFAVDWDEVALSIQDISITFIELDVTIGGVEFLAHTDFTAGETEYFEWYTISTVDDACCGDFSFDLSIYFLEGGLKLFDVALIEANMELQVASQFAFTMGLEINVNTGAFTLWTVGFEVTW